MASYSRATLPEEFYDKTSDMLLVQPEPQYLYAMLMLQSLKASLEIPPELGLPFRPIGGVGADYTEAERDRLMIANPMFTDVIAANVDFAGAPGNTIRINRPSFANTTYTQASRQISTGTTITTTPIAVASQQTNLTLFRYGGPYDSTNNRVAPLAIEGFDANMGVHKAAQINGTTLKRDCHRFIDAVYVSLLDNASTTVYPEGMSTDNDATVAGSFPFTFEQMSRTEQQMDDANLPTFPDGFRVLVLAPTQIKQLKDDRQYSAAAVFFKEYSILFPQYVGSVGKFHIFRDTTLTSSGNSSSVAIKYGHAIAPGALLAGMGRPLRVAASTDDNYGETAKVIWIGDLAFGLADNTFCVSVRSSA